MTVDTVIKNCQVVSPDGISSAGIAIDGEKIVAMATEPNLPQGKSTIDAKGNYVIPGVLDNHTHFGGFHPLEQELKVDSLAAAYGGVTTAATTIGLFASPVPGSYTEVIDGWNEIVEKNAYTDILYNLIIDKEIHLKEIALVASKYGTPMYKFLMMYKGFEAQQLGARGIDDGDIYIGFREIAKLGPPGRAMIHAENIEIIHKLQQEVRESGRADLAAFTDTQPRFVEALDLIKAVAIAKVTKTPLYVVHVSSAETVDEIEKAMAEGVDIIGETCPQYLVMTKEAPIGALGKVNPSLKDAESIERLWEGINKGIITCMGTDHVSPTKDMKQQGMWESMPGFPGVETYLPLMLSEGVNKGRITLEKLVAICCANNAKAFGLFPQKGVLRVGSDADLVIVDLKKKVKLSAASLHHISDFTIYEGMEVKGWPVLTMLRGNIMMEDGKPVGKAGTGKYIPRSLAA